MSIGWQLMTEFLRRTFRATHSTNPLVPPPEHTICIKASKLQWWKSISPRKKEYKEFNELSKDILHDCVGEAHVKSSGNSKTYDPLLKLYYGRPLMITRVMTTCM
jgi:hypothetical protein